MEYLKLSDTNTGFYWWKEARTILNKAIKAYNKFLDSKISLKKFEKKAKNSYITIIENNYCVSYEQDFDVITALLRENNCNVSWYSGF